MQKYKITKTSSFEDFQSKALIGNICELFSVSVNEEAYKDQFHKLVLLHL